MACIARMHALRGRGQVPQQARYQVVVERLIITLSTLYDYAVIGGAEEVFGVCTHKITILVVVLSARVKYHIRDRWNSVFRLLLIFQNVSKTRK